MLQGVWTLGVLRSMRGADDEVPAVQEAIGVDEGVPSGWMIF